MAPEEIKTAIRRSPFVPFRLTLTEGSAYEIRHPELCLVGRRSVIIGLVSADDPDLLFERSVTADLLHVVKLEPLDAAAPPAANSAS